MMAFSSGVMRYFYPRPPRGRRRENIQCEAKLLAISIHALREEGDKLAVNCLQLRGRFLSTPSARRATPASASRSKARPNFYPRPPRGGRRLLRLVGCFRSDISIHALREEGDDAVRMAALWPANFYPRPPRGGRPSSTGYGQGHHEFLSTPSARRATSRRVAASDCKGISIHALREAGDQSSARRHHQQNDFYPRPPRGGRPAVGQVLAAQWAISIHALREEGD